MICFILNSNQYRSAELSLMPLETMSGSVASEKAVELIAYDFVQLWGIFNFFYLIPRARSTLSLFSCCVLTIAAGHGWNLVPRDVTTIHFCFEHQLHILSMIPPKSGKFPSASWCSTPRKKRFLRQSLPVQMEYVQYASLANLRTSKAKWPTEERNFTRHEADIDSLG